ncbi:hypothetical protein ACWDR3_36255, partial [Streptomyces sp. NPDC001002]
MRNAPRPGGVPGRPPRAVVRESPFLLWRDVPLAELVRERTGSLFGRWMHATGWAGPLVMLGFAG